MVWVTLRGNLLPIGKISQRLTFSLGRNIETKGWKDRKPPELVGKVN